MVMILKTMIKDYLENQENQDCKKYKDAEIDVHTGLDYCLYTATWKDKKGNIKETEHSQIYTWQILTWLYQKITQNKKDHKRKQT